MHTILKEKVSQGLDVRVMYDDMGTIHSLPTSYANMLESEGIKCVRYNKINPFLGAVMNHRDHRKIMVIDGTVAFSGGMNLADEYINQKMVFGHWKDNVIRVKGEAVWSYTVLFLTNWNAIRKTDDDYTVFKLDSVTQHLDGYISPYGETPFDGENTGQNVYMNILNRANEYVYICTPYLIIDTELENALILAAKRGVDVRIITPGIPDKKIVWNITRSFYRNLIDGGVKIYEYTPGFIHGKVFVSDDIVATVGTINLDYRSLYLHFENGKVIDYYPRDDHSIIDEIINLDESNQYPGEIAILPGVTEISKTCVVFQSTLLDENAACHLALGCAYPCSINHETKFEKEDFEKLGLNYSNYHIDVMFGDDSITIQAISKNNEIKLIMEKGEWRV